MCLNSRPKETHKISPNSCKSSPQTLPTYPQILVPVQPLHRCPSPRAVPLAQKLGSAVLVGTSPAACSALSPSTTLPAGYNLAKVFGYGVNTPQHLGFISHPRRLNLKHQDCTVWPLGHGQIMMQQPIMHYVPPFWGYGSIVDQYRASEALLANHTYL